MRPKKKGGETGHRKLREKKIKKPLGTKNDDLQVGETQNQKQKA